MSASLAAPVQPLHVFAWIVDSGLRDSLKSLSHALLRRVDRGTWRWPRRHGARGGVTVADLADGAGLSRRHAARCLRSLEERGLVRTTFRPFEVSEYELVPERWQRLANQHRQSRAAEKARTREARIAAFNARRDAARAPGAPASDASAAPVERPARRSAPVTTSRPHRPSAPAWALRHGRRLGVPADTVFSLVGGAAAAILGDHTDPTAQGGAARPVLRLWEARGRPDADALVRELDLIGRWARTAVHPEAVSLRGLDRRGDGIDRSRDARALCDAVRFEQRLELARLHAAAQSASAGAPSASPAAVSTPAGPPIPELGSGPPWVSPGQPTFLPGIGPRADALVDAWLVALDQLRGSEEHDRGAIDIFLSPLRPVALVDGVVALASPSLDMARWIGAHLTAELAELSQSMGAPLGLVTDPGSAS